VSEHDFTDLDRCITAVARQISEAPPPLDLRARVMAQLDERAGASWSWTWMPAAAAVLAVVVAAAVFVRFLPSSRENPAAETAAAARDNPSPSQQPRPGAAAVATPAATIGHTRESHPANDETAHRISEVQAEWQARALAPLSQLQALTFESIQPDLLAIRPLETRPLVINPIGTDGEDRF